MELEAAKGGLLGGARAGESFMAGSKLGVAHTLGADQLADRLTRDTLPRDFRRVKVLAAQSFLYPLPLS